MMAIKSKNAQKSWLVCKNDLTLHKVFNPTTFQETKIL